MGKYNMIAQHVDAWKVEDLLQKAENWTDMPPIIEAYHNEDKLFFHPEKNEIELEVHGERVTAQADYWIVYNHGWFDAVTDKFFQEQFVKIYSENHVDRSSVGADELKNRFGFHKAAIEGPNASAPLHSALREVFLELAIYLDSALPNNRAKSLALTKLEEASMWSHKTLAAEDPLEGE